MKYWEIIARNLKKAGWSWAALRLWTLAGEQSGLLTPIAMGNVSFCERMKN
jgi:hypothetical protein